MQGRLAVPILATTILTGCHAYMTVEGTIDPQLFEHSHCEFFMRSSTGLKSSSDITQPIFVDGMLTPPDEDMYTVRVDCKAPDGTLLASRQEITTLGGYGASTLYMGLISDTQDAPAQP